MPRIQAPTIRENRDRRSSDLRRAARELVVAGGPCGLSMLAAAHRAGLSRPAAYDYFPTAETLLVAVVADELDTWTIAVHEACSRAPTPESVIDTFVETSVRLMESGRVSPHVVACALWLTVQSCADIVPRTQFLVSPLSGALAASGAVEPDPAVRLALGVVLEAGRAAAAGSREAGPIAQRMLRGLVS